MADLRHWVQTSASTQEVYPLVASAQGFRQWWAADITEPAGALELGFFKCSTIYRLGS
jgi:hypothetical protein